MELVLVPLPGSLTTSICVLGCWS